MTEREREWQITKPHANKPTFVHLRRHVGTQVPLSLLQSESWNLLIIDVPRDQINARSRLHSDYLFIFIYVVTLTLL